ncbi:MAG TPA: hypothetical protein VFJ07_00925 [Streptosporangiaceae bacterium]|nr:hypothetical protein [Streptosporangiaceae bacterium]
MCQVFRDGRSHLALGASSGSGQFITLALLLCRNWHDADDLVQAAPSKLCQHPNPAWAPSIDSISSFSFTPGQSGNLSGTQLAGLSQGAAYGDDVQDNTNFPLVRITNQKSGVVTYARTSNWTSVSIAPGAASSTRFTIPSTTPAGPSTLVVVANGIASQPVPVTIR